MKLSSHLKCVIIRFSARILKVFFSSLQGISYGSLSLWMPSPHWFLLQHLNTAKLCLGNPSPLFQSTTTVPCLGRLPISFKANFLNWSSSFAKLSQATWCHPSTALIPRSCNDGRFNRHPFKISMPYDSTLYKLPQALTNPWTRNPQINRISLMLLFFCHCFLCLFWQGCTSVIR